MNYASAITILLVIFSTACSNAANEERAIEDCSLSSPSPFGPASQKDYSGLKDQFYSYNLGQDSVNRPLEFQPQVVLPRLHPWFQEGKTFCLVKKSNQTIYYKLSNIPEVVISDINHNSKGITHGIGILNGKFWRDIKAIQNHGIEIGFVPNNGKQQFAGFFSSYYNLIAFDIFANPGTPRHELRHYKQHLVERKYNYFQTKTSLVGGYQCLETSIRFFGELDANAYQIKDWINTFEYNTNLQIQKGTPLYPQAELFVGFLYYPFLASTGFNNLNCESSLVSAINAIVEKTELFRKNISKLTNQLALRSTLYVQDKEEYSKCQANKSISDICQRYEASIKSYENNVGKVKEKIYQELRSEAALRPNYIKSELKKLDQETQNLLSDYSGGFQFLINSVGYKNEK